MCFVVYGKLATNIKIPSYKATESSDQCQAGFFLPAYSYSCFKDGSPILIYPDL